MGRGKDKFPRRMNPRSLANLQPAPRQRPDGMERVETDIFLPSAQARAWRRLSPLERGELIVKALAGEEISAAR